jgi:Tfp pilus assembly protein PilN
MKAVNLLPPDYSGSQRSPVGVRLGRHPAALGGTAVAVVAVGVLGFAWQSASTTGSANQKKLTSLQVQLAAINKTAAPVSDGIEARLTQLNIANATRVSWDGFMSRLGRVLPEDVWLTGLTTANAVPVVPTTTAPATGSTTTTTATPAPAPTPVAGPAGFTVTGYTYSQSSVARLMRRLELLPWLTGIQLQASVLTTVGTKSAFQFIIVGGVNSLPAKEAS